MAHDMNDTTRAMDAAGSGTADRTQAVGGLPAVLPVQPQPAGGTPGAGATQMGSTLACPICRTTNSTLETYCSECGFLLVSTPGAADSAPVPADPELKDAASGRTYRLKAGTNLVGRENAEVLLMDGTVSRRHATIQWANGAVTVTDLGSTNGSQVDGTPLTAQQPVVAPNGATLRFGNSTLSLTVPVADPGSVRGLIPATAPPSAPEPTTPRAALPAAPPATPSSAPAAPSSAPTAPSSAPAADPALYRLKPVNEHAHEIQIPEGTLTIGRRAGNTVILAGDPYVSGRHAEILSDQTGCYLTDLGSTNGTTVNGQQLEAGQKQLLLDGDEVGLGQGNYLFETLELPDDE